MACRSRVAQGSPDVFVGGWVKHKRTTSKVARCIHTVVKDSNGRNPVVGNSEVDHVSLNTPSTIARTDVLTAWSCLG